MWVVFERELMAETYQRPANIKLWELEVAAKGQICSNTDVVFWGTVEKWPTLVAVDISGIWGYEAIYTAELVGFFLGEDLGIKPKEQNMIHLREKQTNPATSVGDGLCGFAVSCGIEQFPGCDCAGWVPVIKEKLSFLKMKCSGCLWRSSPLAAWGAVSVLPGTFGILWCLSAQLFLLRELQEQRQGRACWSWR